MTLKERMLLLEAKIKTLEVDIKDMKDNMVSKDIFNVVKIIAFGLVGTIVMAFLKGLLDTLLKK